MLEYDRINISEGIDVNKTNLSKEFDIWHYWYFKDVGFKYEPYICNGCHDLMQKAMSFNVAVVYVKGSAYRIHFSFGIFLLWKFVIILSACVFIFVFMYLSS